MKKFIYSAFIVLFSLIITSCHEDNSMNETETISDSGIEVITYSFKNPKKSLNSVESMPLAVFSSETTYKAKLDLLADEVEAHEAAFLEQWSGLTDDELDAKEIELNYDPEQPLTDFENQMGLRSLRQSYLADEAEWLKDDILDDSKDPEANPIYNFDDEELAVLNQLAEVKIGTIIYKQLSPDELQAVNDFEMAKGSQKMIEEGETALLLIDDGDINTLVNFNEGDLSVVNNDNVSIVTTTATTSCKDNASVRKFYKLTSNRAMQAVIKVTPPRFDGWDGQTGLSNNGKVKGKVKSLKKSLIGWVKSRANVYVKIEGNVYNGGCSSGSYRHGVSSRLEENKAKAKAFIHYYDYSSHYVLSGGIKGTFGRNGVYKELYLTW